MPEETGREKLDRLEKRVTPLPWANAFPILGELGANPAACVNVEFAVALANAWPSIKSETSELSVFMLQYKEAFEVLMELLAVPVMEEARRNKWSSSLAISPGGTKRKISQFLRSVGFSRMMELRQTGPMSAAQYKASIEAEAAAQKAQGIGGNSKGLISPN